MAAEAVDIRATVGGNDPAAHDHGVCVETLLNRARRSFDEKGMKLTSLRLRVLEEIAASHDAMGAYDVLERLSQKSGGRMAPISVYRAIDALQEAGLVHRLESRNAYFACHAPHTSRQRHMALVCETCAGVTEVAVTSLHATIEAACRTQGFELRSAVAEAFGVCATCQASPAHGSTEGRSS